MTSVYAHRLAESLLRNDLLAPEQAAHLPGLAGRFVGPRELAQDLIRRGWLTP